MTGYQSLRSSAALLDLSARGKIRASGEDRARLLHALTTNDMQSLQPGQGCYTYFLNAQGRILGDANVYNLGESFLLDTEPELAQKLYDHVDRYIIADDVTLTNETSQWACFAIEGPSSADAAAMLAVPVPAEPFSTVPLQSDGFSAAVSLTGAPAVRIFLPLADAATFLEQAKANAIPEADAEAAHTVRLEHGKPRYGEDVTERYLSQETNQMQAVVFGKGCYLGQEIVERVRSRAQIHRILTPLRIESATAPQPGAKLHAGEKEAGEITSAAFSPAAGATVALAYVRVEQMQAKQTLTVDGLPVTYTY